MAYEMKVNSGSLFPNTSRREGKDDPNAQGRLLLSADLIEQLYNAGGDQLLWVSCWTKEPREEGKKRWQSLSVRQPRNGFEAGDMGQRGSQPAAKVETRFAGRPAEKPAFDDDIPF